MRRLYDEALHTQHQAAADRIDECRLQPGAVLLKKFFCERREEFHHVEERPLLLDHLVNRDVLECDYCRHRGAFLSLIKTQRMLLVQPALAAITGQEPVPGVTRRFLVRPGPPCKRRSSGGRKHIAPLDGDDRSSTAALSAICNRARRPKRMDFSVYERARNVS